MSTSRLVCILVLSLGLFVAGCGGDDDDSNGSSTAADTGTTTEAKEGPKIALISPFPRNDASNTEGSVAGLEAAVGELEGAKLSVVDNVSDPQEQVRAMRQLAGRNDIVFAASGSLRQVTDTVAPEFPDTQFIQILGATKKFHENVTSALPQLGLNAIVTGAVMANRSKSGRLGFISGLEIPASQQTREGLKQASKEYGAKGVQATFTGDYADIAKAKQAAQAQISNGADQILGDLGEGLRGMEQAAAAASPPADVYQVFTLDCEASDQVIGSAIVGFAPLAQRLVTEAADGSLKPGALLIGLKDPEIMGLKFCPGRATSSDEEVAKKVTDEIIAGTVKPASGVAPPDPGYAVLRD